MNLKVIFIFLAGLLKLSSQNNNSDVTLLLSNFLTKLNFPFKITTYICWPKDQQILLWNQLCTQNFCCQNGKFNENISTYFPPTYNLFLLDADCNGSDIVLNKANQLKLLNHPYKWIIWGETDRKWFQKLFFSVDSSVFIIKKIKKNEFELFDDDIYKIKSFYKLTETSLMFLENEVAEWHSKSGFVTYNKLNSRNRANLQGLQINLTYTAMFQDSYKHLEDFRDTHFDPNLKTCWFLINYLLEMANLTSKRIIRPAFGKKIDNTSRYDGIIGDLQSGTAEMAGNSFFILSDRLSVVEYVAPCCPSYMKFIFKAPPLSFVSNIFVLPFNENVWYSCSILIPVIFIVVYLIVRWENTDPIFKEKNKSSSSKLESGIVNVLVLELGAITQQGAEAEPKSNAGRVATIITFISLMFLFTAYSANIVALLQSTAENIKNPEDFLNYSIALGMRNISFVHHYFKSSREPIITAIYDKMSPKGQKPNFLTLEEGVSRIQKDFFAFQTDPSSAYKIIAKTYQEYEKCNLREMTVFNIKEPYIAIKRKSPYKEIIKVGLRKMMESGIQRRIINRIYSKKPECRGQGSSFGSAAILDCYAAYVIFGIGICISFLLFCFEIFFYKKKLKLRFIFSKIWQK